MKVFSSLLFLLVGVLQVQQAHGFNDFFDGLFCRVFGFLGSLASGPLKAFLEETLVGQSLELGDDLEPYDTATWTGIGGIGFDGCTVSVSVSGEFTGDTTNGAGIMPPKVGVSPTVSAKYNAPAFFGLFAFCFDDIKLTVDVTLPVSDRLETTEYVSGWNSTSHGVLCYHSLEF